jgi:hypothetical protein
MRQSSRTPRGRFAAVPEDDAIPSGLRPLSTMTRVRLRRPWATTLLRRGQGALCLAIGDEGNIEMSRLSGLPDLVHGVNLG